MRKYGDQELTQFVDAVLKRVSGDAGQALTDLLGDGRRASIAGHSIAFMAFNESEQSAGRIHAVGIRIDVALDGRHCPNLTSGSVALENTVTEAQKVAVSQWFLRFGAPLLAWPAVRSP